MVMIPVQYGTFEFDDIMYVFHLYADSWNMAETLGCYGDVLVERHVAMASYGGIL